MQLHLPGPEARSPRLYWILRNLQWKNEAGAHFFDIAVLSPQKKGTSKKLFYQNATEPCFLEYSKLYGYGPNTMPPRTAL